MDEQIARIAASQHGVISRAQARSERLTRGAIAHRIAAGRWLEITARVYRLAGTPETDRSIVTATVLSAGAEAVATAGTALALHGVHDFGLLPARVVVARRPHSMG